MTKLNSLVNNILSRSQSPVSGGRQGAEIQRNKVQQPDFTSIAPIDVAAMTLDRFEEAGGLVPVRSRVLEGEVVFAADRAIVPETERRPVYRVSELRALLAAWPTPTVLRGIHRAKVILAGQVISGASA